MAGQYPVKRFTSISGAGTSRLYGSKAFDAQLELEFFLDDDSTALLLSAYHDSKGGYEVLDLPANIYSGMSSDLQDQIRDYYSWRFAGPPTSQSVMPGRSKISVTLVGGLDI